MRSCSSSIVQGSISHLILIIPDQKANQTANIGKVITGCALNYTTIKDSQDYVIKSLQAVRTSVHFQLFSVLEIGKLEIKQEMWTKIHKPKHQDTQY
jgi:hypothetical protein